MKNEMIAYEVTSPSFSDMSLPDQIAAGVCDWAVEVCGAEIYGRSESEALTIAASVSAEIEEGAR